MEKINQFNPKDLFTIPNIICYFRILCIPAFITMAVLAGINSNETFVYISLAIFAVAAFSDILDGALARKFNWGTGVGMLLDPLADKLMHVSMAICLCFAIRLDGVSLYGYDYFLHWGYLIAIALKEVLMICIAPVIAKTGITIKANMAGKIASATLSAGFILCFFHKYVAPWDWAVITVAVAQSYFALYTYLVDVIKQLIPIIKEKRAKKLGIETADGAVSEVAADGEKNEKSVSCDNVAETQVEGNDVAQPKAEAKTKKEKN